MTAGSGSFLKKRTKTLWPFIVRTAPTSTRQFQNVFGFLFSKMQRLPATGSAPDGHRQDR
jgi:hypothetical protein